MTTRRCLLVAFFAYILGNESEIKVECLEHWQYSQFLKSAKTHNVKMWKLFVWFRNKCEVKSSCHTFLWKGNPKTKFQHSWHFSFTKAFLPAWYKSFSDNMDVFWLMLSLFLHSKPESGLYPQLRWSYCKICFYCLWLPCFNAHRPVTFNPPPPKKKRHTQNTQGPDWRSYQNKKQSMLILSLVSSLLALPWLYMFQQEQITCCLCSSSVWI